MILSLAACAGMLMMSQPVQQQEPWEWYLDEVVKETFVGRNYFEYYYSPGAGDMEQQRSRGEVTYFLNSPEGLNCKKVRDMVDRLMRSYDDIQPVGDWHMTSTTYWKEFRFEKNKFRFSVKRKALDDGTYYVSVTETAGYYKSLGKGKKADEQVEKPESEEEKPERRSTRRGRHQVVDPGENSIPRDSDVEALAQSEDGEDGEDVNMPVITEKQRRQEAREQKEAEEQAERARRRQAQEQRREEARAQKEAEKQRKAEEKRRKEEEKRLKKEEERQRREQERLEREAARKQASAPKSVESKYHYTDVALWLSEKYDFMQTAGGNASCTMYSTAVKDVEMAKLAIKNALKGSNARMAVPWRVNDQSGAIETGYTVDGHVLVFTILQNDEGRVSLTITEVSAEMFESFKQSLD